MDEAKPDTPEKKPFQIVITVKNPLTSDLKIDVSHPVPIDYGINILSQALRMFEAERMKVVLREYGEEMEKKIEEVAKSIGPLIVKPN